jgi:hypothetical protein
VLGAVFGDSGFSPDPGPGDCEEDPKP